MTLREDVVVGWRALDHWGDVRREPFRIQGLTSFGEGSNGELYATAQDGVVYRLT